MLQCVNILIVEDNRHLRRMLLELVGAAFASHAVVAVARGSNAMALCRDIRPELVLMDVGLPDANGIDLTAEIRSLVPESKVVIVSNHCSRASVDAARAAGAAAYVFKDEIYDRLLPTIVNVLNGLPDPTTRDGESGMGGVRREWR
jgi:DNA-binding NarL/FixJ family response regulator